MYDSLERSFSRILDFFSPEQIPLYEISNFFNRALFVTEDVRSLYPSSSLPQRDLTIEVFKSENTSFRDVIFFVEVISE